MAKSNKVAIVTGSATGLGASCALDLAGRGWNVAINYTKSKKEADETYEKVKAKGVEAILVQADMGQDADCKKLAAEIDRHRASHLVEALERRIVLAERRAGIGDQEIDRMDLIEPGQPIGHRRAIGHVDGIGSHHRAPGATGVGDLGEARAVAAGEGERDAGRCIVEGERFADAARGTGDDDVAKGFQALQSSRLPMVGWRIRGREATWRTRWRS